MKARLTAVRTALVSVLLAATLYACASDDLTGPSASHGSDETSSDPPPAAPAIQPEESLTPERICGETTVTKLVAGRDEDAGQVTVTNDEDELSIVYRAEGDWELVESHLSVTSDVGSIPRTRSGNPRPGRFGHTREHDPGSAVTRYDLALNELGAEVGDGLVIAAHADLLDPGDPADPDDDRVEGAWADGTSINETSGGSWATYFEVEVQGCEAVTEAVGSEGGTVIAEGVTLEFPEGALDEDVRITVEPVAIGELDLDEEDGDAVVAGTVVDLGPDGLEFDEPVEITLAYDEGALSEEFDEADLRLTLVTDALAPLTSDVNADANTVSASLTHFTVYAVSEVDTQPLDLSISEEIVVSDSVSIELGPPPLDVPVSETIAVSDSVSIELGPAPIDVPVSEEIVVSDSVSIELGPPPLDVPVSETIAVSDSVSIELGPAPVSGSFAYVALQGADSVAVIDRDTEAVTTTISVGPFPYAVAVRPDGSEVYVTNRGDGSISVIDVASQSVVTTLPNVVNDPIDVAFSPDGTTAYVVDNDASLVGVIDASTRTLTTRLTGTTRFSRAIDLTSSGDTALVVAEDSVVVLDLAAGMAVDTVGGTFSLQDANLAPDDSSLWATDGSNDRVLVFDRATLDIEDTVTGILTPRGIAIDDAGTTAWVANRGFAVTPIDLATRTVGTDISLSFRPGLLAVSTDGSVAYVAEERGGSQVAVVDLTNGSVVATMTVGSAPAGVALTP